jgi:hypothetical protein
MNANTISKIDTLVKKVYYNHERFNVEAAFALLYHKEPLSVGELSKFIRISDEVIALDETCYFIVFQFTSEEKAYKASQNIIHKLDQYYNTHSKCFIAVDSLNINKSPQNILCRLKQIITLARQNSSTRVETEDVLDKLQC